MAKVLLLLCGIIVFQSGHEAAPSENSHPVISMSDEKDVTLDSEPPPSETHQAKPNDASQSQRQKRFYDYLDYLPYNFPSAFPYPGQPHYSKRDGSQQTGVYGTEDALSVLFKRLHEIVRDVRYQNVPLPAHTPIPAYIPFLFIPQFNCGCGTNNQGTAPPTNNNFTPQPINTDAPPKDVTATTNSNPNVTFDNRVGLDDKVQNWGIVTSKPVLNDFDSDSDGSRPISFDPIPPEEPLNIPVPPVDHGTVQAGEGSAQIPNQITSPPPGQRPPSGLYQPIRPVVPQIPPSNSENFVPTLCDGAIISCCNKPIITEKCFEIQGCEDPTIYGSPCDPKVQLKVIEKFNNFHKRRSG